MTIFDNSAYGCKLAATVNLYPCQSISKQRNIKNKFKFLCKKAFTLAEVLITLTIIGVVAAMTIPTLTTKYQKHQYVVGLKKVYSELSQAVKMMPLEVDCSAGDFECLNWDSGTDLTIDGKTFAHNDDKQLYLLSKVLKPSKICYSFDKSCIKTTNRYWKDDYNINNGIMVMPDGMIFSSLGYTIYADVNGVKGPNQWGRDMFVFKIAGETKNGVRAGTVMPVGSINFSKYTRNDEVFTWKTECTTEKVNKNDYADTCAARVLEEDAMNY